TSASKFAIVNVASPSAPILVGSVDTPGAASGLALGSGYAYVAAGSAVQVVSITTPSRPVTVSSVATSAWAVALAGTRLYAVAGSQLKILDVTSPAAPVLLSTTTAYGAQAVAASGTIVYLATPGAGHGDPSAGVRAVDVSNPAAPRVLQQLVVPGAT